MQRSDAPVMLVAGEGGHTAQMQRLRNRLVAENEKVFCIGEVPKEFVEFICPFGNAISRLSKVDSKLRYLVVTPLILLNFCWSIWLLLRFRPKGVIFLGPLFCVPFMLACKIFKVKSLFIESWSRFDSTTSTAKLATKLRFPILYQNNEMNDCLPKGSYCGRL